ncbi:hypothetical protein OGAPHI_005908 [Ogataea philodendri]|uniref:Nodulin-like domain-containing protein n=1 Tax=Ogataea philodendri TaxID=1378263 RepID=A0A9P8T1A2_9ASCO|nr:uncharacterized protein OGAPHI_005908 [Ogataea philodendri]KAH3661730.1 hypothetical protein OGAPHI_005908 [Ogataea philodendri]
MSAVNESVTGQSAIGPDKSTRKIVSLVSSCLVAMASGTPYLFGMYSPQVMAQCRFTAEDASFLTFGSTAGSSIGGLAAGLLIDKFGPKFAILLGAALESSAFLILYLNYKYRLHHLWMLIFAMVNVGFGSVLPFFATLKVSTYNFPHHRGVANACPVSSYGLAALLYASISTIFFAEDTQGFLRFISIFAGVVIGSGYFFIDIYETEEPEREQDEEESPGLKYLLKGHRGSFAQLTLARKDSSSSLFSTTSEISSLSVSSMSSGNSTVANHPIAINYSSKTNSPYSSRPSSYSPLSSSPSDFKTKQALARANSSRITSSLSNSPRASSWFGSVPKKAIKEEVIVDEDSPIVPGSTTYSSTTQTPPQSAQSETIDPAPQETLTEVFKKKRTKQKRTTKEHLYWLLSNKTFICYFFLSALYCGTGQVYIFGVGFIVKAQLNPLVGFYSSKISAYQALQVSILSLCNFLGRIVSGVVSDFLHKKLKLQRLWVITVFVIVGICAALSLLVFDTPQTLSLSSGLYGLCYGAIYGAMPAILAESFGSRHFATTWSVHGTGSVVAFLLLSNYFGRAYDSQSEYIEDGQGKIIRACMHGNRCYYNVFTVNVGIGLVCLALCLRMIYANRK